MQPDPNSAFGNEWFLKHLNPHEDMLRAWLKSRFPDRNDIDDIIQEAYLRVMRANETENLRSPKAFLFATARNLALDWSRHDRIVQKFTVAENEFLDVLDTEPDSFENFAQNQDLELLTKAIQNLPPRCRQIFTLRKLYGMPQKKIARMLNLSVNTVSAQLANGIRKCSEYISQHSDWENERGDKHE